MSVSIDLFFESSLSVDEFPAWAMEELGLTFKKCETERTCYHACYLGSILFLSRSTHRQAEAYDLSRMNLHLQLDRPGDASRVAAFTVLTCALIASMDGAQNGLLLYDCQAALARYVYDRQGLFDEISGVVVKFPDHITNVFNAWRKAYPEPTNPRS